jgi:DMSO/TMAO reductase YedYZ molybdopterin-dependent catalytic subunit
MAALEQNGLARGADPLIVRSSRLEDFETPIDAFTSWITANDRFFVRSHLPRPQIQLSSWALNVDGAVERPLKLRLEDLKALPRVTAVVTLECAGNGRAFFTPPVAGVQWQKGAVGTARWTGVRLSDVLSRAGVKAGARFVLLDGADQSIGRVPDFVRSVPLAKAIHPDTLLVDQMNGETLPMSHGFPLRAIIPGWEGAYSVKWLTTVRILEQEHDGFFVQTAYRYPTKPIQPGAAVDARDMEPLTGMPVKAIIVTPRDGARLPIGSVRIAGFAWAGEAEVARVDVSSGGTNAWDSARLGPDRAPYAWRAFHYELPVNQPGSYDLRARATDTRGRVQPTVAQWNPSGYLWNAIDRVRVIVGANQPAGDVAESEARDLPVEDTTPLVQQKCLVCHDADLIVQQRLTEVGWSRELDKMMRWGADMSDRERTRLLDYFVRHFPQR